jgi:hypothetical protein
MLSILPALSAWAPAGDLVRVVCAWCEAERRAAVVSDRSSGEDPIVSHGICRRHEERVLAGLPSVSFPDVSLLIVVAPGETRLYDYLTRALAGVRGIRVVVDRRRGERRQRRLAVTPDRRAGDRRRRGQPSPLGFTMVRFSPWPGYRRGESGPLDPSGPGG